MNFAIVNGQRVPIDETTPHDPWQHAETIGAPQIGDRLVDKPLTTMNVLDVVRRLVFGKNAERPREVQREDPFGTKAFAEGKGPMPILPLPEAEVGQTFSDFTKAITANRRHVVGLNELSDALNIRKSGLITEPEYHTAIARLYTSHAPNNPIVAGDEVAQRLRTTAHDMDEHVKGIAQNFPHVDIPTSPLRDIAAAGASNPIGGGGPGSSFVQRGRGAVLKLYPQLGHYEPVLNAQGKRVGSRLVDDPISIPDAAKILTSVNKQLNDRLGPQAMRRVRTDMLANDPVYAALDATATALRKGIDQGLEAQGIPGVRAFRQDQAAVIKLQQIAEKVEGKGTTLVRSTAPPPGRLRQAATDIAETTAAKYVGGKVVSRQLNRRLTIDEAVNKAFRLMKPAPNLSYPMMPAHVPGAAAGAAGAGRTPGGPGGGPGGGAAPTGQPGASGGPSGAAWENFKKAAEEWQRQARTTGETWEQWGRRNGVPPSWWNQGGKPGEPWGPRPPGDPWGVDRRPELTPGTPAPPVAPDVEVFEGTVGKPGLPKAPGFIVDASGRVRKPGKTPLIPADNVWPRPAMSESYKAPKNDPSFVRAVKGVYAKVFKRAEPPAAGGRQPLSAPETPGPLSGGGPGAGAAQRDAARTSLRAERAALRAEDKRIADETLDTLTQRYVEAGHPDHPDAIRAKLVDDLRGIEELYRDAHNEEGGGSALLRAIAKYGGISVKAEGAQKAEIEWLKEFRDGDSFAGVRGVFRDLARGGADAKRMNMQRQVMGKGARKVPYGGLSLDDMLTSLRQDPQFQGLNTINDLTAAIEKAARAEQPTVAEMKAKALADLVYHTERDIAGHQGPDVDDGFAAFSAAVDEIVKPKGKQ